jgi:hypothetical protein
VIADAQHSISLLFEPTRAPIVVLDAIGMRFTIDLDHQPDCGAAEIDNVISDGVLPTEPIPV